MVQAALTLCPRSLLDWAELLGNKDATEIVSLLLTRDPMSMISCNPLPTVGR
jgi:hypothetical protein